MTNKRRMAEVGIVGAGPAGMSAAVHLAREGVTPVVFDLNATPGGQIYRQLTDAQIDIGVMGNDYARGLDLIRRFESSGVDFRPGTKVWWAQRSGAGTTLGILENGEVQVWEIEKLILATGAMERGWPFKGWELPGVMNAGAAQILLKQGGLLPEQPPVLAGSGPLLYLLAWQYLRAGLRPKLILDLSGGFHAGTVLSSPRQVWLSRNDLIKGVTMMAALRKASVSIIRHVDGLVAEGNEVIERIKYRHRGEWHAVDTSLLLSHFGVTPEPQVARGLGLAHDWRVEQQCFVVRRNVSLQSEPGIWVAGDGGGIGGAINAEREGHLAALSVLTARSGTFPDHLLRERRELIRARARDLEGRLLLDRLFSPPQDWLAGQSKSTLICRCEAVALGELELAMTQGAEGQNQLKAFTRCGMGPCQGRLCGESVNRLLCHRFGQSPDSVGYYHIRPPLGSITLGELQATPSENIGNGDSDR